MQILSSRDLWISLIFSVSIEPMVLSLHMLATSGDTKQSRGDPCLKAPYFRIGMMEPLKKDSGEPSLQRPSKSGSEVLCGIAALRKNFCFMTTRIFSPCVPPRAWTRSDSEKNSNTYARARSKRQVETHGRRDPSPTAKEFRSPWSAFRPKCFVLLNRPIRYERK
jgi:hypothetical protein